MSDFDSLAFQYGTTATKIEEIRLELGSGVHGQPGYTHVDAVKLGNVDIAADVRKLDWVSDSTVSEIYAAHLVEHFSYTEVVDILKEWRRALKPGGKLVVKMPDLDFICRAYVSGVHSTEEIMVAMFGGFSDYPGGPDGWEKISGNPAWERGSIKDGELKSPGKYTEWGAHKALYTFETFKARLEQAGFKNIQRIVENDWELHVVACK